MANFSLFGILDWVIRIKLVIPIFHTEFDPLQVLLVHFGEIPPTGDFGDFWWLLLTGSFEWSLWYHFLHRIWCCTTFVYALWLNSANWRFCDFWWLLLALFEWRLWYQLAFHRLFYLTLYSASKIWRLLFFLYTYISIKESSGLDQKLFQFLDIFISFKEPSGLDHN